MAKNFKGKAQKPPLSTLDKVIYTSLSILGFGGVLVMFLWWEYLESRAYADPAVIACFSGDSVLLSTPLFLLWMTIFIITAGLGSGMRQPIFGNKSYKKPAFTYTLPVYPLFSREFWENLDAQKWKKAKRYMAAAAVLLPFCALLAGLSIHPRKVLTEEQTFVTYDFANRVCDERTIEEVESLVLEISTYKYGIALSGTWFFDGAFYEFAPSHFEKMTHEEALAYILQLKEQAPQYRLVGTDLVERYIDRECTPAEAALVYQLFNMTSSKNG